MRGTEGAASDVSQGDAIVFARALTETSWRVYGKLHNDRPPSLSTPTTTNNSHVRKHIHLRVATNDPKGKTSPSSIHPRPAVVIEDLGADAVVAERAPPCTVELSATYSGASTPAAPNDTVADSTVQNRIQSRKIKSTPWPVITSVPSVKQPSLVHNMSLATCAPVSLPDVFCLVPKRMLTVFPLSDTGDRPYKCQHCGDQFARR